MSRPRWSSPTAAARDGRPSDRLRGTALHADWAGDGTAGNRLPRRKSGVMRADARGVRAVRERARSPVRPGGTDFARKLWNRLRGPSCGARARRSRRVQLLRMTQHESCRVSIVMNATARSNSSPSDSRPSKVVRSCWGRGPEITTCDERPEEGELVVTEGNFKIDAEIQIQAKPSMMTPEGGGGGRRTSSRRNAGRAR